MADYIIVGAGSAGCVLANRLSADPAVSVVLIEAGGRDSSFLFRMPAGFFPLMQAGKGNWNFETVPQKHLDNRTLYFPRGKVWGGSSAINGMVVSRGNSGDYDRWAQLGNSGWSYADCLPFFKMIESYEAGDPEVRGHDGPMQVTRSAIETMPRIARNFIEAGMQAGHPFNPDVNSGNPIGMAQMQGNYGNARRQSASATYLLPALDRPNLTVISKALVHRVIIEDGRAVGVEYSQGRKVQQIRATREVILSGGAINSPHLLQLSGIGDPADLIPLGIAVSHELPGVGKNLQDHLSVTLKHRITQPISALNDLKPLATLKALAQYFLFKTGATVTSGLDAWAHLKSRPDLEYPDIQMYIVPLMYNDHGRDVIKEHGVLVAVNGTNPASTGTVRAVSSDPRVMPAIDPDFLSDPDDARPLRAGIRLAREILAQQPFDDLRGTEYAPGADAESDEALDSYIRQNANSIYHPVGTCSMGQGPLSVVDEKLRVRGIAGLRVVDASVMPLVPSGNTNFPTMMIAEKAAQLILSEA